MCDMKFTLRVLVFVIFVASLCTSYLETDPQNRFVNIVVIGCRGDLARRYLWPNLFKLYKTHSHFPATFRFFCAQRRSVRQSEDFSFAKELDIWFKTSVQVEVVAKLTDYERLCSVLATNPGNSSLHIFYLAIPPSGYSTVVTSLQRYCGSEAEIRYVLEKPFGSNLTSAVALASSLNSAIGKASSSLFLVDHYLGKKIVQMILPFRRANNHIEGKLMSPYVSGVEVSLLESLDVKDRINYYATEGVFRDMLQNHATELLSLVLMDVPKLGCDSCHDNNKLWVLKSMCPPVIQDVFVGQYDTFQSEVGHKNRDTASTPTFASALLRSCTTRWHGVPLLVTSGKKLHGKASFIRISLSNESNSLSSGEILFYIGGDAEFTGLNRPLIACSKELHCNSPGDEFSRTTRQVNSDHETLNVFRNGLSSYDIFELNSHDSAYYSVLLGLLLKDKTTFVSTDHLFESWKLWDKIIDMSSTNELYKYSVNDSFRLVGVPPSHIRLHQSSTLLSSSGRKHSDVSEVVDETVKATSFAGVKTFTGNLYSLSHFLARDISRKAYIKWMQGEPFHLGLPGGRSAVKLMHELAFGHGIRIEWSLINIWLVDERCVFGRSEHANSLVVDKNLLQFVNIPYRNIHFPQLPFTSDVSCNNTKVANLYNERAKHFSSANGLLDYVILGVGSDGHIASIFPDTAIYGTDKFIVATNNTGDIKTRLRVSMSMDSLLNSTNIAIIIAGADKQDILDRIRQNDRRSPLGYLLAKEKSSVTLWIDDNINL